ncbi:ABC transporter B family member 15 [Acorus gramineus]|uniref:ABC transporter B family member 15 n=1 Tax=Acorus gramineus TaxID=55184 RepID=A0AAV9B529_ACOGR|nr:ABC transporter B family member 15 [Acorus gramineus]
MLMAVGTIGCVMDGASTPLIMLALSQVMNMYAATNFLMNISTFFTSQLVAFYLCWRLALVMTPALTLLVAPMIVYGKLLAEVMKNIQKSHMAAGGIAEQALSSIRTVFSYVAESYVEQKFSAALELGLKLGVKQGLMKGMAFGTIGIAYALWSLQAWYGSVLVIGNGAKGGDVFNAGVCIIVGGL